MATEKPSKAESHHLKHGRPLEFVVFQQTARKRWVGPTNVVRSNAARHQWNESRAVNQGGRKARTRYIAAEVDSSSAAPANRQPRTSARTRGGAHSNEPEIEAVQSVMLAREASMSLWNRQLECHAYPSRLPVQVVTPLTRFMYQAVQRVVRTASHTESLERANVCMQTVLSHPGPFHAGLMVAMIGPNAARPLSNSRSPNNSGLLDLLRSLALKSAQELVSSVASREGTPNLQQLLQLSFLAQCLACRLPEKTLHCSHGLRGPRQAPFHQLEEIHFFVANHESQAVHLTASNRMIEMAGGIDKIPAWFRGASTYHSIVHATQMTKRVALPWQAKNGDFEIAFERCRTRLWGALHSCSAHLMDDLRNLAKPLLQQLQTVVLDLQLCLQITDSLLYSTANGLHETYLADARRWTQYQILDLPTYAEMLLLGEGDSPMLIVYETVRISINIFALIAVFPVPPTGAPFEKLATSLIPHLQPHRIIEENKHLLRLFLWVATMGTLASIGTSKRPFFVDLTNTIVESLQIHSWIAFKDVLQRYLWYSEASDFDGQYLWLQIQQKYRKGQAA